MCVCVCVPLDQPGSLTAGVQQSMWCLCACVYVCTSQCEACVCACVHQSNVSPWISHKVRQAPCTSQSGASVCVRVCTSQCEACVCVCVCVCVPPGSARRSDRLRAPVNVVPLCIYVCVCVCVCVCVFPLDQPGSPTGSVHQSKWGLCVCMFVCVPVNVRLVCACVCVCSPWISHEVRQAPRSGQSGASACVRVCVCMCMCVYVPLGSSTKSVSLGAAVKMSPPSPRCLCMCTSQCGASMRACVCVFVSLRAPISVVFVWKCTELCFL